MTAADEAQSTEAPSGLRTRLTDVLHRRATWVLIDQGIVSLGNFITGKLLADNLVQSQYGIYNVMLETLLYLNGLQAALIIYPMTLRGASGDRESLKRVATASMILTVAMLPILGAATVVSVGILKGGSIALAAVAALLLWQLQETMRRALMSDLRFADTVWGDAVRYVGQSVLIFAIGRSGALNLRITFFAMGATAAVAVVIQSLQVGLKMIRFWQLRTITSDFWHLGRWMLLANGSGIISSLGYWYVLERVHGPPAAAAYGAVVLPFKLANPIMNSIGGLITPAVARSSASGDHHGATRAAIRYTGWVAALLGPYFLMMALFPSVMLRIFFRHGSPYLGEEHSLQLFVANYVAVFLATELGAWLSALGHSRLVFHAQCVNMIVTLLIGLPLTIWWGVTGVIIGGLLSASVNAAATAYFIHKTRGQQLHHSPGSL